jgi:hypothetical protein
MAKVTLQVGDHFQQAWKGCTKPIHFTVLEIDREKNSLKVKCTSIDGYSHEEDWDDLDVTEIAFETGEYKKI